MGLRGPAPVPTAILAARGSPEVRGRQGEPRAAVECPTCPGFLSKEAKLEWGRQVKELERIGVIAKLDRSMLAAYCEAWAEFAALSGVIDKRVKNGGEAAYTALITEGVVNAKNRAVERMSKIALQFGFSPSARTRIRTADPPQEEGPRLADYTG